VKGETQNSAGKPLPFAGKRLAFAGKPLLIEGRRADLGR
jgi:hypothetical protein